MPDSADEQRQTIAQSREAAKAWVAAGKPKPKPSGEPRRTGRPASSVPTADEPVVGFKPSPLTKTPAQLEAGFARAQIKHGKMPPGSKVTSRNADGTPETYQFEGETYYAPGSVQYETGWRSRGEYMRGQKLSYYGGHEGKLVPKDAIRVDVPTGMRVKGKAGQVAVRTDKPIEHRYLISQIRQGKYQVPIQAVNSQGKPITRYITTAQASKLGKLFSKDQFNMALRMGIIPQGSEYAGGAGGEWSYIPPGAETYQKIVITPKQQLALKKYTLSNGQLDLSAAVAAGYTDAGFYTGWNVTQAQLDKIRVENIKREHAQETLKDYRGYGGNYNLAKAIVNDDPEVQKALRILFTDKDRDNAQKWADKHWGAQGLGVFGGEPIPGSEKAQGFWRKITPWKEEKGETFASAVQEVQRGIGVPRGAGLPSPPATVPHDLFYVSPLLKQRQMTDAQVKQFNDSVNNFMNDIAINYNSVLVSEKAKAQQYAGTGQFGVSPALRGAALTPKDVEKFNKSVYEFAESVKQQINASIAEENKKALKYAGTGQFGVSPALQKAKMSAEDEKKFNKLVQDLVSEVKQQVTTSFNASLAADRAKAKQYAGTGQFGVSPALKKAAMTREEAERFNKKVTDFTNAFIDEVKKEIKESPLASKILFAAPVVSTTPIPHDDAILWLAIGGAVAYTAIKTALDKNQPVAVPDNVKKANDQFIKAYGYSATPADVVIVTANGMASALYDLDAKTYRHLPGVSIVRLKKDIPALVPGRADYKLPGFSISKVSGKLPGVSANQVKPVILLPTPKVTMEELTGNRAGILSAAAGLAVAEENLKQALPGVITIPKEKFWDEVLEGIEKGKTEKDLKEIFEKWGAPTTPLIGHHYRRAYLEYLQRRAILEAARKQYIASLNPTPIKGNISDDAVSVFATYMLAKDLGTGSPKAGESMAAYIDRVLGKDLSKIGQASTAKAKIALANAIAAGATETEAIAKTKAAAQTAAQTAVETLTKTSTLTNTQTATMTQTLTQTATQAAVAQAVATGVLTAEATATGEAAATAEAVAEAVAEAEATTTTGLLKLKTDATDEEKREYVKRVPGAVTWNMGKLGREDPQDIWHVKLPDGKHIVVRGKAPDGAEILADGPGSAYKTTQTVGKKRFPFPAFRQQHGAVMATIRPAKISKGAQISFSPYHSVKRGKIYHTKAGGATLLSRHPLGRSRR